MKSFENSLKVYQIPSSFLIEPIKFFFKKIFHNGNSFEIKTKNFFKKNIVKSVMLNGKRVMKPFLIHSDLMKGGVLEFEMSKEKVEGCYEIE